MANLSRYKLLLGLAAAILVLDQATKVWVDLALPFGAFFPPDSLVVIPGFLHIVHVGNTGAAWSMLSDYTWLLTLIGIAALVLLFVFRRALELEKPKMQLAFGFIVGGIIGNLVDRIRLGYVIDFLDFQFGDYHFPSFNVADSAITIGVALYILYSFREPHQDVRPPEAKS